MRPIIVLTLVIAAVSGVLLGTASRAADTGGMLIEWEAPDFQLTEVIGADGRTYTHIEAEGYPSVAAPGSPLLPTISELVALPPGGDFGLDVIAAEVESIALQYPIEPASAPGAPRWDSSGERIPVERAFALDTAVYAIATPIPTQLAALGEAAWMRDHRVGRLTYNPFRYRPARNQLDVVRRLSVRIWWKSPLSREPEDAEPDVSEEALSRVVINPEDLAVFRASGSEFALRAALGDYSATTVWRDQQASSLFKVSVVDEGLYALDHAALSAAGLPMDAIDPASLRLYHGGDEVSAQWEGDGDGDFESGERLLFYARPRLTRYAGYDVYWLSWGDLPGARMASRSGAPGSLPAGTAWKTHLAEENAEYDSASLGRDGDRWFWRRLKLPDLTSETFDIALDTPDTDVPAQLEVYFRSYTSDPSDPDHRVHVRINGTTAGVAQWDGQIAYTATMALPAGVLQSGQNSVSLSMPGDTGSDVEGTWIDAIAIDYGLEHTEGDWVRFRGRSSASAYSVSGFSDTSLRVYDVTAPHAPKVVTGFSVSAGRVTIGDSGSTPAEYLVLTEGQVRSPLAITPAKDLIDPPGGADYVIITHPDFQAALAPLVAHRTARGLRVSVVDVEAVYDRFGEGRMDPDAIRSFLAYAYANWPSPALQYALLVGDATYDPRHYRPDTNATFVPAYLADVDPEWGETASDNRYADLTGDPLPELQLGRFPANTTAEVTAIVDKILAYETNAPEGGWNRRLVFGADNPSSAGNHHAYADAEFLTYATPDYGHWGSRIYLSTTPGPPHLFTTAAAAQDALISTLNRGALFYSYFGHASWHQEAVLETDNYAPLFHRDHIARLDNQGRWPVVLHMTCLTGRYIHRTSDTLDESLLRTQDVGAVAVWGPSGSGMSAGHKVLHRSFYEAVFDYGETQMGAAVRSALVQLYAAGTYDDLIETYHIFGDPAMMLAFSSVDLPFSGFLPIIAGGY
jgi:hypothetical protein